MVECCFVFLYALKIDNHGAPKFCCLECGIPFIPFYCKIQSSFDASFTEYRFHSAIKFSAAKVVALLKVSPIFTPNLCTSV